MAPQKNWSLGWKTTQPPIRETQTDAFSAEFEEASGNTVRVRITAHDLKDFGKGPESLEGRSHHTEQVLRAILETYVKEYGKTPADIDARDLNSLGRLKHEFREKFVSSE